VNLMGGIVYRDPARVAERGLLGALLPGGADLAEARRCDLSGGVLAGIGAGVVTDQAVDGALVADLDLSNLDDLPGIADGRAPGRCLRQLHAQYGTDFATRLRGAFTLAIWDPARRRLVLAADRFGFRRMYYAVTGDGIAFVHGVHGSDHHLMAFAKSHAPGLHHSSWDVGSADEVGLGSEQMRNAGFARGWGVGRHVLGSNFFYYVKDPWGSFAEYSFDIDFVPHDLDWPAADHPPEDSFYVWGPPPLEEFIENHEVPA